MKCVRNLSVQLFLTELWQFSKSSTDSFLTHLGLMTHFRDISKYHLTDIWLSFATDRFMTDIWHILDSFLTDFCNWQFSDTYQTHFWHISEIYGTHTSQEYQVFSARDWDGRRDGGTRTGRTIYDLLGWEWSISHLVSSELDKTTPYTCAE